MNYGRFFVLDDHTSRLPLGIAVFNYKGLKAHDDMLNEETPKYPIYLTITKEIIDFRVHYYDGDDSDIESGRHLHHTILSLPLSANIEVKDGLTDALSEGYNTIFPVKKPMENNDDKKRNYYLYTCLDKFPVCKKSTGLSYADLTIFNVFNSSDSLYGVNKPCNNYQDKDENDSNKYINTFIRKLILDFLFDLEHTKVFQNSPHYEYISIKLNENYFFKALANKCMFYYYRELIEEKEQEAAFKTEQEKDKLVDPKLLMFYSKYLFKAEIEWTKSIRSVNSEDVFQESKGWFGDPEKEMNGIYAKRSSLEKKAYKLISAKGEENDSIRISYRHSSKWYIKRYSFLNAPFPRFKVGKKYYPFPVTIILMFSVILFCGTAVTSSLFTFKNNTKLLSLLYVTSLAGLIVTLFAIIFILFKNRFASRSIRPLYYFWGVHVFLPRLLIAIVAAWVSIIFSTDMLGFDDKTVKEENASLQNLRCLIENAENRLSVFLVAVCACISLFVYYQINKYNPYGKRYSKVMRTIFFCCLAFLYSYLIGKLLSIIFTPKEIIPQEAFNDMLKPSSNAFFVFSLFAMFIGIFIQLTLDEKPMTESI